jgi:hypothetical protein
MEAPRHVLLVLDDEGDLHSVGEESDAEVLGDARRATPDHRYDDDDDDAPADGESDDGSWVDEGDDDDGLWSPRAPERRRSARPTTVADGAARTTSSRFWGVYWDRQGKKWAANFCDANGKNRHLGLFDDEEAAARAVNKAIRDAGLEGKRRINEIDAAGALVPKSGVHNARDRSAVVAPDPARAATETTSKFWGVCWDKSTRRWKASYYDANSKLRHIDYYNTQEAAAHAVNAAIRALPPDVQARRNTNPVVDGQLVPPERKRQAPGHGPPRKSRKRRREDAPAAGVSARRSRE